MTREPEKIVLPKSRVRPKWNGSHWRIEWGGGSCLQLFPSTGPRSCWMFANALNRVDGTRAQAIKAMDEMVLAIRAAVTPKDGAK